MIPKPAKLLFKVSVYYHQTVVPQAITKIWNKLADIKSSVFSTLYVNLREMLYVNNKNEFTIIRLEFCGRRNYVAAIKKTNFVYLKTYKA